MKVTIKDFQSLKGTNVFEFPVGITIIQGKTDSGKTTVFYAIEDCLANTSGVADVINWDAKSCEVTIENNGGYVKWIKTPTSCEYVDKNGKPYIKASKLDSRDIDDLGFYFDKKDNIVNIHGEWSTLFPFAASDTEMFKLFEDIFNISSSFTIIDLIKKDEQEKKAQINQVSSTINELTKSNNTISAILDNVDVSKPDLLMKEIQEKQNTVSNLLTDFNTLSEFQKYVAINIPDELDTSLLTEYGNYYNTVLADFNSYQVNMKRSEIEIPEIRDFNIEPVAQDLVKDVNSYKSNLTALENYEVELSKLDTREKEIRKKLNEIKVCPTCGQSLESCKF